MLGGGVYPGMITATIGTGLLIVVVVTSVVLVARAGSLRGLVRRAPPRVCRDRARVVPPDPDGNELVLDSVAADYWRALPLATIGLVVVFRLLAPIVQAFRFRLRVAEVDCRRAGRRVAANRRTPARPARGASLASSSSGAS